MAEVKKSKEIEDVQQLEHYEKILKDSKHTVADDIDALLPDLPESKL